MKVFVSYSFRPENAWVSDYIVPLVGHFGHDPVTGQLLDSGPLDEEVKRKMRQCRRVISFVTRAQPRYDPGATTPSSYEPPDWVRDEIMMARGDDRLVTEYRESLVTYGGVAPFHAYRTFDRTRIPELLVDIAAVVSSWPVGPIQLRLSFPEAIRQEVTDAANAGTLEALCTALEDGQEVGSETLKVHLFDGKLIALFWIKPKPTYSIDIVVRFGARNLAGRGISPVVREASLSAV